MSKLRAARLFDLSQVLSWIKTEHDCVLWSGGRLPFPIDIADLPKRIDFSNVQSRSLVDDELVLGFGQLLFKQNNRAHLVRLIVNPDHRGQGLGKQLAEQLLQLALESKPSSVSLNVERTNAVAISIYQRLGFVAADLPADEPASQSLFMMRPGATIHST
jgi:ribosomal protein S18 acetylase RimI-like enzyme